MMKQLAIPAMVAMVIALLSMFWFIFFGLFFFWLTYSEAPKYAEAQIFLVRAHVISTCARTECPYRQKQAKRYAHTMLFSDARFQCHEALGA
tara:strand:- start:60 stop:335 length:276 start_codon:yes stop_codon:yes gene_type:complete